MVQCESLLGVQEERRGARVVAGMLNNVGMVCEEGVRVEKRFWEVIVWNRAMSKECMA